MRSSKSLKVATLFGAAYSRDWTNPLIIVEYRFQELVAETLGLNSETVIPQDRRFGDLTNDGNWTGVLGLVQRGEADMGISITRNHWRNAHFNFSYPYIAHAMTFATRQPSNKQNWAAVMHPFDAWTWTFLLVLLIVMPLLWRVFLAKKDCLTSLALKTVATLLRQPLDLKLDRQRDRLLFGHWLLWSQVLTFGYMTLLLSLLTMPLKDPGITTFQQLSAAVGEGRFISFAISGTAFHRFLNSTDIPHLRSLSAVMERNGWFLPVRHFVRSTDLVSRDRTAFMHWRFSLENSLDPRRDFVSHDSLFISFWAAPLKVDFCCRERLDTAIHRINAAGLYQKFTNEAKTLGRIKDHSDFVADDPMQPLSMDDLWMPFVILLGGHGLATLVLLGELVKERRAINIIPPAKGIIGRRGITEC